MFGDEGALLYGGNDHDETSGKLELRRRDNDGKVEILADTFKFENCDDEVHITERERSFFFFTYIHLFMRIHIFSSF